MSQTGPSSSGQSKASYREQESRQYLTITLDQRVYGILLQHVAEICPNKELRRMPHMPDGIEGLLDLRGKVIPVMNLRKRLDLPEIDRSKFGNILILDTADGHLGVLVDKVESVVTCNMEEFTPPSDLLAGKEGFWINGFLVQKEKVTVLLDTASLDKEGGEQSIRQKTARKKFENSLDESLKQLIESAPEKTKVESEKIIPQMQASILHTEEEMGRVIERIEVMLDQADKNFNFLTSLKNELVLGHLKGKEKMIAELENNAQRIQEEIFDLMGKIQFQDIARQRLDRVLCHIKGLHSVIGNHLHDVHNS